MADDVILTEDELDAELQTLPGWEVRDDWLRREYKTPGFSHTAMLVNAIGYLAEAGEVYNSRIGCRTRHD